MANNLAVLDGAAASKTLKTTDNAGVHTPHHNVDTLAVITAGASADIGAVADAAVAAGAAGSVLAKLRSISRDLVANIVLAAGSAIIGKVGIDQTTPGTTDSVTVSTAQGLGATNGTTADAAVAAGATGSLSAKLRAISRDLIANIVLAAGEGHIGEVGGRTRRISASVTRPADTTQYAIGDALGTASGSATANFTLSAMGRINQGSGTITGVSVVSSANQTTLPQMTLWLFDTAPTNANDNAAWAPADGDLANLVAIIPLSEQYQANRAAAASGNAVIAASGLNRSYRCASGTPDMTAVLVLGNAYTPVSAEAFTVLVHVMQD